MTRYDICDSCDGLIDLDKPENSSGRHPDCLTSVTRYRVRPTDAGNRAHLAGLLAEVMTDAPGLDVTFAQVDQYAELTAKARLIDVLDAQLPRLERWAAAAPEPGAARALRDVAASLGDLLRAVGGVQR